MAAQPPKPVDPLDRQDARMVGLRLGFDVFTAVDQLWLPKTPSGLESVLQTPV